MSEENENNESWETMAKILAREAEPKAIKSFEDNLANDQKLREQFDKSEKGWEELNEVLAKENMDVEKAWQKQKETVLSYESKSAKTGVPFFYKVAATVALIAVAGGMMLKFYTADVITMTTSEMEEKKIELPDGSVVFMNENSQLTYADNYNESSRNLILSGEAFFEVSRDESKPFVVDTEGGAISVLGTSFNIITKGERSSVYVKTGTVQYMDKDKDQSSQVLKKGDFLLDDGYSLSIVQNENANILAWKTHQMTFDVTPLDEVFKTLTKAYKKEIEIEATSIDRCVLTAEFDNRSLEEVLTDIEVIFDLTYDLLEDKIVVQGNGCQ